MDFSFRCIACDEEHIGMPALVAGAPDSLSEVPEQQRAERVVVGSDNCVIDGNFFFVRGNLEIPVIGEEEKFNWGVWVSLSEKSYAAWVDCFEEESRSHVGPFFGWLNTVLRPYPSTFNLATMVHLRDGGIRPWIELDDIDHPLAREQREGISRERVAELYAMSVHGYESG